MLKDHHVEICTQTLTNHFSPVALEVIIAANLNQDSLFGLVGHPQYHFDDSAFERSYAYLEKQRQIVQHVLAEKGKLTAAWKAFGRLTHAAQDFYAHSNYLTLWQDTFPDGLLPPPEQVAALDKALLAHPDLVSGRVYFGEAMMFLLPPLAGWFKQRLPRDAHAWMNLDSPEQGPLFPYAIEAARQRTIYEYDLLAEHIKQELDADAWSRFTL
jgi:hypothetical protein